MSVNWGAVCRPKQGQSVSGDTYVVEPFGETGLMVAVIDGLGGGEAAAVAALRAAEVVRANLGGDMSDMITLGHTALHNTRGAVIGLLTLDTQSRKASYVGVGNIGAHVYSREPIKPISKNGILGAGRLPHLLRLNYTYNFGDTFVLYSDGISSRFGLDTKVDPTQAPQALATTILQLYGKTSDDATVVVVRIT
jgi:phosphoserine phosphatase RsbX